MSKRAVVIDDIRNIRLMLCMCLADMGYEVDEACDGVKGMELFHKNSYDLAFLDIKMPKVSGTELLKHIRDKGISTPVIIITAHASIKNAVDCTKLGAVAYLQKPFTPARIKTTVEELFAQHGLPSQSSNSPQTQLLQEIGTLKTEISQDPLNFSLYARLEKKYRQAGDMENAEKYHKFLEYSGYQKEK